MIRHESDSKSGTETFLKVTLYLTVSVRLDRFGAVILGTPYN